MSDLDGPWGVTSSTVKIATDGGQMVTGGYGYMNNSPSSSQPQSSGLTLQPLSTPQAAPTSIAHGSTGNHYHRGTGSPSVGQNYPATYTGNYSGSSTGGGAMVLVGLMVLGGLALLGYITGPSKPAPVSDSRPDNGPVLMPSSETAVAAATAAEVGAAVTTVPPTGANPDGFSPIVPTNPPAPAAFVAPPGQPFDRPLYGPAGSVVSSIAPLSSVRVTHKHRGQDCVGILEVTAAQMRFLSSEPEDAFSVPLSAVEKPKATADGKGFTVRINDDKGLRFEPFNESAARLGAFYAELVAALDGITPQDGGALAQR